MESCIRTDVRLERTRLMLLGPAVLAVLLLAPASAVSASAPLAASGAFVAVVDFATLTLEPQGNNCRLQASGTLVFSGTLEGEALGTTRALVLAPCEEVLANPPGSFRDVFRFDGEFTGTVNGVFASASIVYQGGVQEGGDIQALIRLSRGLRGVLHVDAVVAVGGVYAGVVQAP